MKKFSAILLLAAAIAIAGCGRGAKDKKGETGDLKVLLEEKKKQKIKIETEIRDLEQRIGSTSATRSQKLVSIDTVRLREFAHFIELQGNVEANDIVNVAPRGFPAQVRALYVRLGDVVRRGQLLAKLDDAVILQEMESLKLQRDYAQNMYNRQKNLWDQGIGTEVQLVTARNNVDALNKQIATLTERWKTSMVYAPVNGVVNELNVKVGEVFTGSTGMGPQIQIVNNSSLKAVTQVPENYVTRVKRGMPVEVVVPETGRAPYQSSISVIGATIHSLNRSFAAEAKLPSDPVLKPNQSALIRIRDYMAKDAIAIPVNLVQSDENGKYVFAARREADRVVARKVPVNVGEVYNGLIEIRAGLKAGDLLITQGYQLVYHGQSITASL